ncbi:hypothetical protein [Xanthomonas arboricola]|uniref:hypothetical protein n=1 Tax=Xanthomonas arboricola TaxID=56448 RepID=UPI0012D30E26|nr:hypothetical protein [Xanthomonas arboricola]
MSAGKARIFAMNGCKLGWMAVVTACALAGCGGEPPPVPGYGIADRDLPKMVAFDGALAAIPAAGRCALDAIDGKPASLSHIKAGEAALFAGWMATSDDQLPTDALLVLQSGPLIYASAIHSGGKRPDVAAALNSPKLIDSGYNVEVSLASVRPGTYQASIIYGGSSPKRCPLNVEVSVIDR